MPQPRSVAASVEITFIAPLRTKHTPEASLPLFEVDYICATVTMRQDLVTATSVLTAGGVAVTAPSKPLAQRLAACHPATTCKLPAVVGLTYCTQPDWVQMLNLS